MTTMIRPAPGAPREYSFPRFSKTRISNGMQVVVASIRKLPVVTLQAVMEAGGSADPAGREGLAHLTALLTGEGTTDLSAAALTDRLEQLGSALAASADWDYSTASLTVVSNRFAEALRLLADVLTHPALPERELTRLRDERIAELLQIRTEPRSLADEWFSNLLYDPSSRYARPLGGTSRSVSAASHEDVQRFHAERYSPAGTTLIVCGDVDPDACMREVEAVFGAWRGDVPQPASVDAAASERKTRFHLVEKEGAPQSEIRIGQIGVARKHEDFFSIVVMNAVLGGLFSSRINLNLRERHGYTYGAFSHFDWRRSAGPFIVSTAVRSDVTSQAITEVMGEIERFLAAPVERDELTLATSYLTGVFPIRFETTNAIANALTGLIAYDLPDDYFDRYRENVAGVTEETVLRAARKHLATAEMQVVVVGDPSTVRSSLESIAPDGLSVQAGSGVLD